MNKNSLKVEFKNFEKNKKIFTLLLLMNLFVLNLQSNLFSYIKYSLLSEKIEYKDNNTEKKIIDRNTKNEIKSCILSGIIYPSTNLQRLENNSSVEFLVKLNDKNELDKLTLIKSSKNIAIDKAVEIGILRCEKFPIKNNNGYEHKIHIIYKIYED